MLTNLRKSLSATAVTAGAMVAAAMPALAQVTVPGGFFKSFDLFFNRILFVVLAVAALLVFFYLIWGGIEWITSGGDKGKTEKARDKITASVVGLIILAASYAILTIALNFIQAPDLNTILNNAGI